MTDMSRYDDWVTKPRIEVVKKADRANRLLETLGLEYLQGEEVLKAEPDFFDFSEDWDPLYDECDAISFGGVWFIVPIKDALRHDQWVLSGPHYPHMDEDDCPPLCDIQCSGFDMALRKLVAEIAEMRFLDQIRHDYEMGLTIDE